MSWLKPTVFLGVVSFAILAALIYCTESSWWRWQSIKHEIILGSLAQPYSISIIQYLWYHWYKETLLHTLFAWHPWAPTFLQLNYLMGMGATKASPSCICHELRCSVTSVTQRVTWNMMKTKAFYKYAACRTFLVVRNPNRSKHNSTSRVFSLEIQTSGDSGYPQFQKTDWIPSDSLGSFVAPSALELQRSETFSVPFFHEAQWKSPS